MKKVLLLVSLIVVNSLMGNNTFIESMETNNDSSVAEITNLSNYEYMENLKINDIKLKNGKILYCTDKLDFFVEDGIDYSSIGGRASGYFDVNNQSVKNLKFAI